MKLFSLLIVITLLVTGCGGNNRKAIFPEETGFYDIVVEQIPQDIIDFSGYVDSVKTIFLESNDDNLIHSTSSAILTDDMIIICDTKAATLWFFDMEGNYLRNIHRRGRGPGEYLEMTCVLIDEDEKELMVYDIVSRRMLKYDLHGNHISSIDNFCNSAVIRDIINLPNGNFLCYTHDVNRNTPKDAPTGLWETDLDGNFIRHIRPENNIYPFSTGEHNFYFTKLENGVRGFVDQNTGKSFHYQSDTLAPCLSFSKLPGKTARDYIGIDYSTDDFFVLVKQIEKENLVISEWVDTNNGYFLSVFDKNKRSHSVGTSISPFVSGEEYVFGLIGIPSNAPGIFVNIFPMEIIRSLLEYQDMIPEEIKPATDKLIYNLPDKDPDNNNPIIQLIYLKP